MPVVIKKGGKIVPNADRVRQLLDFNQAAGTLTWRVSQGRVKAGKVVAGPQVRIDGKLYAVSRIVHLLKTGEMLPHQFVPKGRKAYSYKHHVSGAQVNVRQYEG